MNIFLTIQKNTPTILIASLFLCCACLSVPEKLSATLSPSQEFQLDFLYQEINQFPDLFINDWTTNSSVQLIVESAELAIQNSSDQTKPIMKQRIIELFNQIGISIEFTPQDLILKIDSTAKNMLFRAHDKERHIRLKKRRHPQQQKPKKAPELQKIKGARRTLRRIKKKLADQEKAAREAELTKIKYNASLKKNPRQRNDQPHETINSIQYWRKQLEHNHLAQQHLEQEKTQEHAEILPQQDHISLNSEILR